MPKKIEEVEPKKVAPAKTKKTKKVIESTMLIWAFKPLAVLGYETGFVQCDESVGEKLLADDKAQLPNVGAMALKPIEQRKTKAK